MSGTKGVVLNVWTVVFKGSRYVTAAKNRTDAANIIGCSSEFLRSNGGLTHDPKEIDAAFAAPGTRIEVGTGFKRKLVRPGSTN